MNNITDFGFYAILTDPLAGYEKCTEILVDYGIKFVQLRIKNETDDQVRRIAEILIKKTENTETKLIINDYINIAYECRAHGVHLGQNDMPYADARKLLGPKAIIGLSTHSPEQTSMACDLEPDYIGVGPVYPTPTKKIPDPVIGIEGMKKMVSISLVPSVAIGGINLANLRAVLEAGAKNFCMVRQFTQSTDPQKVLKETLKIYREYYPG
ncbi:MAG TPA: thiamine phosphate synthase [Chitinispirillaceae bacterium]|nr:thiamine phosphate synthase [Chitinispirillaceae bacterium]